ncbi:MAG: hypothetical protein WAS27_01615 [Candidatus Saccharimonadales bacterium]
MGRYRGHITIAPPRISLRVAVGIASIAIVILIGIIAVRHYMSPSATPSTATQKTPQYHTVLPVGTSIDQLGGWQRISPPDKDPVFAYSDYINDVRITVSQQPLAGTTGQRIDEKVADIAKKFNATTKITAGDTAVYIGTSSKGPQSVIFAKDQTLVLIKSQATITNDLWQRYIMSLN